MRTSIKVLAAIVAMSAAHKVSAEPTAYPTDTSVLFKIINNTNSNILADELDSRTVWVMPPNTAKATVGNMHTKTSNLGFCKEMGMLQKITARLTSDLGELQERRKRSIPGIERLSDEASKLYQAVTLYANSNSLTELAEMDDRIKSDENRLTELYKLAESCQPEVTPEKCARINNEMSDVIKDKRALSKSRAELTKTNSDSVAGYDKRLRVYQAANKRFEAAKAIHDTISDSIFAIQRKFHESYGYYGKMEGARASIVYKSTWDDNLVKLRSENPEINFSKVATKKAKLMAELLGVKDIDASGAIKAIGIGGDAKDNSVSFEAYPQDLSTNVVLSLIGACPLEHPDYFDVSSNVLKDMQYGLIITYDYDTVFKLKAKATYNMYRMYQKITSSHTSGGFFSSHTSATIEERNFFRDSFKMEWDDQENTISQADKDAREKEMRDNVLLRLASYALPNVASRGDVIAAAKPPTRGAIVLVDGLAKTCPTNVYCQGAIVVATVLDAIFGSSSSTASFLNIQDTQVVEVYSNNQKITKSWITSYL